MKKSASFERRRGRDVDAALAALDADNLREVVKEILLDLDERDHCRLVGSLVDRAARGGSGWAPEAVGDQDVAEVLAFAEAAERVGRADPSEVDDYLQLGSDAFLRKDYTAARRIFGALLRPIGDGEVDLGQHELVDEVLTVEPADCAAQYVVAAYMTAAPDTRAEAVHAAIDDVRGLGNFRTPIREMERVAVEPFPSFDDFLRRWRTAVQREARCERSDDWDCEEDQWLREVVLRLEGVDGLAKVARASRRESDLRAWCHCLVEAGDWKAALAAFDEAAEIVRGKPYERSGFLDGSALAAQELRRNDLPARLERAWRAAPSALRLRRWLGSATSAAGLKRRAAEALGASPKQIHRQRGLLHVLLGQFEPAARLLAAAPGLGWSDAEHPGHLLFPLFEALLGVKTASASGRAETAACRGMDIEEHDAMTSGADVPHLMAPEAAHILEQAGVDRIPDGAARDAVLAAMRKAAERRLAGVTQGKRRRHYGHAAQLAAACAACDGSPAAARWVASIKSTYRRFSALRAELDRALGPA